MPVALRFQEAERVGLDQLTKQQNEGLPGDLDALRQSVGRLHALLENALKYVSDVCEEKQQPNNAIGRFLVRSRHACALVAHSGTLSSMRPRKSSRISSPDFSAVRSQMDTVCAVPRMSRDNFEKVFNDGVQDILLVMYLAQITRTQLALSEKVNTIAVPN